MKFEEIILSLKQKDFRPVYFLTGEESFYIDKISDYISKNVLEQSEKDFNQHVFYGKDSEVRNIISAAKQCNSLFLPKLNEIISLDKFLDKTKNNVNKFFADLESKNKLKTNGDNSNSLLLIGPEGDFTREEKDKIKGFKFKSITLGDQILRSETAAVVGGYMLSEF